MRLLKFPRPVLLGLALVLPTLAFGASSVLAYGHADQPLAQLEISGNCDNPSFWLCQDPPDGVGVGGVWVWVEADANGTADAAGAFCQHTVGGGGINGAQPVRGEFDWSYASGEDLPPHAVIVNDPNDTYYWIPDLVDIPIPTTPGHYSFHPAPGVTLQIQVAP